MDKVSVVDSRFLILPDSEIVFSANKDSVYQLFQYKNKSIQKIIISNKNISSPILIKNTIAGLSDSGGNEKYKIVPNLFEK